MPAVVEGPKGRANLFNTLDRTGAHFIALGGSSSSSEGEQYDEEKVPLSVTGTKTAQGAHRGRVGAPLRISPLLDGKAFVSSFRVEAGSRCGVPVYRSMIRLLV